MLSPRFRIIARQQKSKWRTAKGGRGAAAPPLMPKSVKYIGENEGRKMEIRA